MTPNKEIITKESVKQLKELELFKRLLRSIDRNDAGAEIILDIHHKLESFATTEEAIKYVVKRVKAQEAAKLTGGQK